MTIYTLLFGFLPTLAIIVYSVFLFWYDNRKPNSKPRIAICAKCKYVVKTKWYQARIKQTNCRTPDDHIYTDFITGRVNKFKYRCDRHNSHGTCTYYKKVWWRR